MDEFWILDDPLIRMWWLKRLSGGGGGEPVYKTISGNPVTFSAVAAPLQQLRVDFSPVQAGSGDPSTTNIRPISGWTGLTATVNGSAVPVSWETEAGTVYGGYVDLVSGELVAEWEAIITTWGQIRSGNVSPDTGMEGNKRLTFSHPVKTALSPSQYGEDALCNVAVIRYSWVDLHDDGHFYIYYNQTAQASLAQIVLPSSAPDDLPISILGRLETPIRYQLTPQIIRTLNGSNTISSGGDTMTVTYRES